MANATVPQRFVYLFKAQGLYKIGSTNSIQGRLATLATGLPVEIEYVHSIPGVQRVARTLEMTLQRDFAGNRVRGEWFNLSDEQVSEVCEITDAASYLARRRVLRYGVPGENFREREMTKRKAESWLRRLDAMPVVQRTYIISLIRTRYGR